MFQIKVVEKIKTHVSYLVTFSENRAVYELMWKKYGRARRATDDNNIRRTHFACWITRATHTLICNTFHFHAKNGFANAPRCYVWRKLPLVFIVELVLFSSAIRFFRFWFYVFEQTLGLSESLYISLATVDCSRLKNEDSIYTATEIKWRNAQNRVRKELTRTQKEGL
jgi:hypothetical protein